jgi:hypothetical protein
MEGNRTIERGLWMSHKWYFAALLAAVAALGVAGASTASNGSAKLDKVTLQLKWVTQAQFA